MSTKKYFIAIVLPEPLYSEIENIKQQLYEEYGLKGALRSPPHITLHRPFEWLENKEKILIDKLSQFAFQKPFPVSINNFGFFEPRVIFADVVQTEALRELHDQLMNYCRLNLRLFNESEDIRGFHPHVTVAFRDLKKPLFYKLREAFGERSFKGVFQFENISLLKLEQKWEICKTFKQLSG